MLYRLIHPHKIHLILFGCIAVWPIAYYQYIFSFSWFFDPDFYYALGGFVLLAFCGLCLILDKIFDARLIKYGLVSAYVYVLFLVMYVYAIKPWLIRDTEERGYTLLHAIRSYHSQHHTFPSSIEEPYFSAISKTTFDFRSFEYRVYESREGESYALISVRSFNGQIATLSSQYETWSYHD